MYAPVVWLLRKQPQVTGKICFNPNPVRYSVACVHRCGQELLLSWWLMWYLLVLRPHLWFSQIIRTFMSQSHAPGLPKGVKKHFFFFSQVSWYCFLSCFPKELQRLAVDRGQVRTGWAELWQCFSLWCSTVFCSPIKLITSLAQEGSFCEASLAFCLSLQQSTWLAAGLPSGASVLWEAHALSLFSAPWHRDFESPCSAWDPAQPTLWGGCRAWYGKIMAHGVPDCTGWGGHLGVRLLKNKVRGLHRHHGEVSFHNKGKPIIARVVSEQSSYRMLPSVLVPASTFSAQLPPILLSQPLAHIWTSNSETWTDGSTASSSPWLSDGEIPAHCPQPANFLQSVALNNSV